MLSGLLALTLAALFAGAALYVSFVEQPARMLLETQAGLAGWQPSYKRSAVMQAGLAAVAFLAGLAAWWQTGSAFSWRGRCSRSCPGPGPGAGTGRARKPPSAGKMEPPARPAHGFGLRRHPVFSGGLFDFSRRWSLKPGRFPESHRSFRSPARRGGSTPGSAGAPPGA